MARIATRSLSPYQLDKAIAETSEAIRKGDDPEQAWRKWFMNDRHRDYARALTDDEIPLLVETLLMEPSGSIIMDKCSDKTARNRVGRLNEYLRTAKYVFYEIRMETDEDGTRILKLIDRSFDYTYVKKQEPLTMFSPGTFEYGKLMKAATDIAYQTDRKISVQDAYYDYGQNWKYTTLIEKKKDGWDVQMLDPSEQKKILYGTKKEYEDTIRQLREKHR